LINVLPNNQQGTPPNLYCHTPLSTIAPVYINPPQNIENLAERKAKTTIEIKIKTGQGECYLAA
jgi:hypothetical protein